MAVNPDDFIFHSDFWYPVNYNLGSRNFNNSPMGEYLLASGVKEGDYYSTYMDYGGSIAEIFPIGAPTMRTYTKGGNLYIQMLGQAPGATFTGIVHWRHYPRDSRFNFLSANNLEQTAKSFTGSFKTTGSSVRTIEVPSGLTGKHFARGTYRIGSGPWITIPNSLNNSDSLVAVYSSTTNTLRLEWTDSAPVLPSGTDIYYNIQLVPVSQDSSFIFNSERYSFAIPYSYERTVNISSRSIPANTTQQIYGPWIDVPGEKLSFDAIYKWNQDPSIDTQNKFAEFGFATSGSSYLVAGVPRIEYSNGQVRPAIAVRNTRSVSTSISAQSVKFFIYLYQNNNSN